MSKLIDAIEAEFTGKKKVPLHNYFSAKIDANPNPSPMVMDALKEYRIEAKYSMQGFCQQEELPVMLHNFIKGFKRDAYDSIQKSLLELERALYEQDIELCKSILRDIWIEVK